MRARVNNMPVQHHTINDLLAIVGEKQQADGLHVFTKEHKVSATAKRPPIQYPFRSDHFSVFVITNGTFRIKLNLIEYNVGANDVLIIAPHAIRQFMDSGVDFSLAGIIFNADFLSQTGIHTKYIDPFDFVAQGNPHLQLSGNDASALVDIIRIILQKNADRNLSHFGFEIVQHYFTAFMYELAGMHRKYGADSRVKLTRKEELAMRFLRLLPQHFREERSLQFYADLLYVTPRHLTQTIKELTGKTAGQFIDDMVIVEAKVLLSNHDASVAQVAESLFFSDQFFFSKFFKNHTGIAPTEYRKTV